MEPHAHLGWISSSASISTSYLTAQHVLLCSSHTCPKYQSCCSKNYHQLTCNIVTLPCRDISFSLLSYMKGKEGKRACNLYHGAFKQKHKHKLTGGESLSNERHSHSAFYMSCLNLPCISELHKFRIPVISWESGDLKSAPIPEALGGSFIFSFFSSFHIFLRLKSFWGMISKASSSADWYHHSPLPYPKKLQSCEQTMALTWAKTMRLFSGFGTTKG